MYVRKQGVETDHIAPFPAKNGNLVESMLGKYIYRAHGIKGVMLVSILFLWYQIKKYYFSGDFWWFSNMEIIGLYYICNCVRPHCVFWIFVDKSLYTDNKILNKTKTLLSQLDLFEINHSQPDNLLFSVSLFIWEYNKIS